MIRRSLILLVFGGALGLLFALVLKPLPVRGGESPGELRAPPAQPTSAARDLSRPFVEATRKVRPAVVLIENYQQTWRGQVVKLGTGSGFLVSKEGHVLTNRHVLLNAQRIDVHLADGRTVRDVKALGSDLRSDVAVLKLEGLGELPVAQLGDSDALDVGEWVIAIGAPFELESSVSAGVVSATGRTRVLRGQTSQDTSEDFIQTDAALNPGNSGGPLINLDGQVVGINTAIHSSVEGMKVSAGVGFAIPINLARTVALSLIERGVASRGWLGVEGEFLGAEQLAERAVRAPGGFLVRSVLKGRSADRAGIVPDDVLVAVDGRPLRDHDTLRAKLAATGPGATVEVSFWRGGEERKLKVLLDEEPLYMFGLEVQTIDARTAAQVGVSEDTKGVVITRVEEGSPAKLDAEKPLLYPGDVIVAIDFGNRPVPVHRREDFIEVMTATRSLGVSAVRLWVRVKDRVFPVELRRAPAR